MKRKRVFSALLATAIAMGSVGVATAAEKEVGAIIRGDIGFVGGDFENVTLSGSSYYAPDMSAFTTYGSSHTIDGLTTKTSGEGKLPIVVENGNKVFKLQPKDLASAVSGKSLNNAFGMKLVTLADYGKIKDITDDVTVSFRIKVTDPECLDSVLFAVRPSHTACGQHQATSLKLGTATVSGSNLTNANIKKYFPAGEWVDVELTFAKSTFYDKADFATHTWGGSHVSGTSTHTVTAENAIKNPVFYVRPYFNYGTTSKNLENYSIYLDDFAIDAPTSSKDSASAVVTDLTAEKTWAKSTMEQATVITEVTKNGKEAWQFDPALDISLTGYRPNVDSALWERFGQRAHVSAPLTGITFEEDSWYKLTAYVMVADGVAANATLGTTADSTKTWVGKPILGIKLTGNGDQTYETKDLSTRANYRNNIISENAKTDWQKVELCFKPIYTSGYNQLQLNATAGFAERFVGEYKNMVLPTYWIRKDITLEKVETKNVAQGENIVDSAAPYYQTMGGSNSTGWLYAFNGEYTAYPKQSGRPADVLGWETITYHMNEPLDSSKNYRVSFDVETTSERFTKARVNFIGETSSATLAKEIPASATDGAVKMVFDTRFISTRDLKTDDTPLSVVGNIVAIDVVVDSAAVSRDGSLPNDTSYTISNLKIERIEPALEYDVTLSGQTAILKVTNGTDANWQFDGMLFVSEHDKDNNLVQIVSDTNVSLLIEAGKDGSVAVTFKEPLTTGNTVRAFLWDQGTLSPVIDSVVLN